VCVIHATHCGNFEGADSRRLAVATCCTIINGGRQQTVDAEKALIKNSNCCLAKAELRVINS